MRVYEEEPLTTLLQRIESEYEVILNYSEEKMSEFRYTGELYMTSLDHDLAQVLKNTAINYERTNDNILLYHDEGQPIRLCGYIKDAATTEVLPFATVRLMRTNTGSTADHESYLDFSVKASQFDQVVIEYLGYLPKTVFIKDWKGKECPDIYLDANPNMLNLDIVIKDYILQGIVSGRGFNSTEVNFETIESDYIPAQHDVLNTVQLLPGITSQDGSASRLQIRGSLPDHNLILWEGAPLYNSGHFFGMLSSINPYTIDRVRVHKGVFNPDYADRIGGIIDLSLSDQIVDKVTGSFGITTTEGSIRLRLPLIRNTLSLEVAGRQALSEVVESPLLLSFADQLFQNRLSNEEEEIDRESLSEDVSFGDYNGKLIFQPGNRVKFTSSFYLSNDQFEYEESEEDENLNRSDNVTINSGLLANNLEISLGEKHHLKLHQHYSNYTSSYNFALGEIEQEEDFDEVRILDNVVEEFNIKISDEWKIGKQSVLNYGYEYDDKTVGSSYEEISTFEKDIIESEDQRGRSHNFFAEYGGHFNTFSLHAGVRASTYNQLFRIAPRILARYHVNSKIDVKASAGLFNQFISQRLDLGINDFNIDYPIWVLANDDFDPLSSSKLAIGTVYSDRKWLFDIEGYFQNVEGITTVHTRPDSGLQDEILGNTLQFGVNVLLQRKWEYFRMWANYTLSNNTVEFESLDDMRIPALNDQRHRFSLVQQVNYKQWSASFTTVGFSGLPYTSDVALEAFTEEDEDFYEILYTDLNSSRLDGDLRCNLGLGHRGVLWNSKLQYQVNFQIINLFDAQSPYQKYHFLADLDDDEVPSILTAEKDLTRRTFQLMIKFNW